MKVFIIISWVAWFAHMFFLAYTPDIVLNMLALFMSVIIWLLGNIAITQYLLEREFKKYK